MQFNQIICNKILALFKTRRKLHGLTYDKLNLSSIAIVKGNNSLKQPLTYSIVTSRGSPAELNVFRAAGKH